jgi:hypothetical protein
VLAHRQKVGTRRSKNMHFCTLCPWAEIYILINNNYS